MLLKHDTTERKLRDTMHRVSSESRGIKQKASKRTSDENSLLYKKIVIQRRDFDGLLRMFNVSINIF